MVREQGYYEPRCFMLLIASILFLPLRDSIAYHQTGGAATLSRRWSRQPQQPPTTPLPPLSSRHTPLPARQIPFLLRPLKDSEREQDITGNNEEAVGEDDSNMDQLAPAVAAAATSSAATTTAAEGPAVMIAVVEGDGDDAVEGKAMTLVAGIILRRYNGGRAWIELQ